MKKNKIAALIAVLIVLSGAGCLLYFNSMGYKSGKACKNAILSTLKSPSTAKIIGIEEINDGLMKKYKITYDAQNSFGAILRGSEICSYDTEINKAYVGDYKNGQDFIEKTTDRLNNFLSGEK